MIPYVPPDHKKVRILKPVEHARTALAVGSIAVLDDEAATKLVKAKAAAFIETEPERKMLRSPCVRCGAALEIVAEPAPHERWTQCLGCGYGRMR